MDSNVSNCTQWQIWSVSNNILHVYSRLNTTKTQYIVNRRMVIARKIIINQGYSLVSSQGDEHEIHPTLNYSTLFRTENLALLRYAFPKCTYPSWCEDGMDTILNYAAYYGYITIINYYREHANHNTFAHACCGGQLPIIRFLIRNDLDIHAIPTQAMSVTCVLSLNHSYIDWSVQHSALDIGFASACAGGHLHIVKYLIHKGADAKWNDNLATEMACQMGRTHVVKYLVKKYGATILSEYKFRMACTGGHLDLVRYLYRRHGMDLSWGLSLAAWHGHVQLVDYMLSHGVDIHQNNDNALCQACVYCITSTGLTEHDIDVRHQIIAHLIARGADPNAQFIGEYAQQAHDYLLQHGFISQ